MAGQFFTALDRDIAGERPADLQPAGAASTATTPGGAPVYAGRSATATANANLGLDSGAGFALGVLVGGILALAGVALGARIGRRS